MTVPNLSLLDAVTSRGLISAGEGSTEFWHPLLPTDLYEAHGYLVALNGWNLNRRLADVTGYSGATATAVELLQMRAPRRTLAPQITAVGTGQVFGTGYFWRYRWRDSRTGETSGLSPLPTARFNLGVETPPGGSGYLGQSALFYFDVADAPAHADTLDLFRPASSFPSVLYLAESRVITGLSYVTIIDDNSDDDLLVGREVISLDVPSGFTWAEGLMWPLARAWLHPSQRTFYWGLRQFGKLSFSSNKASVTQGSDLVSIQATVTNAARIIEPGRVGQRVRFYATFDAADPIQDPTVYRFVKAESATTFRVHPELQVSNDLAAAATALWYWEIEDDRPPGWTFMSEAGKPWLIDPAKTVAAGGDGTDGAMAWFAIDARVFHQTLERMYAVDGDGTEDPSLSMQFTALAAEGTTGLWSGCLTPAGWVYVHRKRGIRLFDGVQFRPLDRASIPADDFKPQTQFDRFEPTALSEVVVVFDETTKEVVVSYVPTGGGTHRETISFSLGAQTWRGPHRESVAAAGELRSSSTDRETIVGDSFGGLIKRGEQALDVTPTIGGMPTTTGTITSVQTRRIFTDSSGVFANDGDERLRGSPIWFTNAAGTVRYFARIADVLSGTQLELDGPPIDEDGGIATLTVGWSYSIGAIRWEAVTACLDGGEPVKPKVAKLFNVRFARGATSESFEVGCAEDGNGTYAGERTSSSAATAPTKDVNAAVFGEFPLEREGAMFQIRLRGLARNGEPQITGAILVLDVEGGTLP